MRLLEHQSKSLLSHFGLVFNESWVVATADEAQEIASMLQSPVSLKAQVPFGGRGKLNAVRFANSAEEAHSIAQALLGMNLRGTSVRQIGVERRLSYERELYVGVTWDLSAKCPVALLSSAGGMEIESQLESSIARRTFDPFYGLHAVEGREMAAQVGLRGRSIPALGEILERLSLACLSLDALTAEINPLAALEDGSFIGLDAHVEIDDDSICRQETHLEILGDRTARNASRSQTAMEVRAQQIDSMDHRGVAGRMVEFDGELGLLIGGGGASLTVFDAIRRYGGRAANYCEVGGNPTEEKVAALTELILSKPSVRQLAVIMNVVNNTRADVMARGVLAGLRALGRSPAQTISVFRIPGSWEQEAKEILAVEGISALGREFSLDMCARLAVEKLRKDLA
ncbi:MAG: acetate--CoA ligase family protein [Acidobacteriota bacterium]|nr:acetate--CoA ligase family protein [Acidobacteriota bacterium]